MTDAGRAIGLPRGRRARSRTRPRGFTLVEVMVVVVLLVALSALALPMFKQRSLRAGRLDAVHALTRLQSAQEQHRALNGLYAGDLAALRGTAGTSPQGLYAIAVETTGPDGYLARATARGRQADDSGCEVITLRVERGFPTEGPAAECWQR